MSLLKPDLNVERLTDIDINEWYHKGIRCILIDLDNTISPWGKTNITEDATVMIANARKAGVTVVLFSNAREVRVREGAWNAGVSYYAAARKPFTYKYKRAFADLSLACTEVMTIGDQIFTDVLGGNIAGCTTVLISPLSEREFSGTKLLRFLEKFLVGRKLVYRDRKDGLWNRNTLRE